MQDTLIHTTLCLLEELNDILSRGDLWIEDEKELNLIVYQCELLIDRTK
jgi:hypothetical protein